MFEKFISYIPFVPLLPLIGAAVNGFVSFRGWRPARGFVNGVACATIALSFLISLGTFAHFLSLAPEARELTITLWPWIDVGALHTDVAFLIDPLTLTMMLVVTGVGFIIHIYATGYMGHDKDYPRFFAYLNLFCFAMLLLVMGSNLFMMFIGWEGVGLCSYLLIGFWYESKPNAVAGMKAFIVNRIGDWGFLIGLLLLFWTLFQLGHPTVTFTEIRDQAPLLVGQTWGGISVVTLICLFLFIGATGKSAQIPLYTWLPDAMAGPTPVSALIHAATMVTAGVYMIARLHFLYSLSPVALTVVTTVGFATALFAATIGFAQNDIKKVLAYSTVSQLGFMFGAMGVAAYAAGIFHLVTHAFFKACLFLGSGSVIHGMSGEQDMRKMGGLKKFMPVTYKTFLLATLAIAGIFPFAGFFSKDEILWRTFASGHYLQWGLGVVAAIGTAIYMFRLVGMTFLGKLHEPIHEEGIEDKHHHPHESPASMTVPLVILAVLSILGGLLGVPASLGHFFHLPNLIERWLSPVFHLAEEGEHHAIPVAEYLLMGFSLFIAVGGSYLGYLFYTSRRDIPERFAARFATLYRLVANKYFVDEFYDRVVVQNLLRLNRALDLFDQKVIDGIVNLSGLVTRIFSWISGLLDKYLVDGLVNLLSEATLVAGRNLRRIQTGQIQNYLYMALGGVVVVIVYKFL
ncbi:MAG: NADH-quinone oxidoreductase subunit L [Deltaproteobacteria bacterium]|nr:NADH-quinone oxidoreductase subunit L [Deltaproteobacteria bacterium]